MRVFKFGGASVKDAEGIRNVASVLETMGHEKTLVVVSAMGKTTNAMETLVDAYFEKIKTGAYQRVKRGFRGFYHLSY